MSKSGDDGKWAVFDECLSIRGGMKEQVDFYDQKWAKGYDEDMKTLGYGAPAQILNLFQKHVPDRTARVIDVVAGSGILGTKLKLDGYDNLDALDGSKEMLKIAQERDIYKNYHCELLEPHTPSKLPEGSYDAAMASGCFAPAHLTSDHFIIFSKLVRKGGKVIFAINKKFFRENPKFEEQVKDWDYDLEGKLKEMEEEGIWKRVECLDADGYYEGGIVGRYFVFEVL